MRDHRRRRTSTLVTPLTLTVILLLAGLAGIPALADPVNATVPASLRLQVPLLYLIFAPVFTVWDGVSLLSMSRLKGLLLGLVVLYLAWRVASWMNHRQKRDQRRPLSFLFRELRILAACIALFVAFVVTGALWHRPMLSLAGAAGDDIVVDFHSHTNASHDVEDTWMRGFDAEANRRWHARAGFDAVFVTDHNVSREAGHESQVASRESRVASRESRVPKTVLCPGIEVSAWRAHVVLLGDTLPVDRGPYSASLDGLLALLRVSDSAYGALSVASLPEYRRNHWGRLDTLIAAGLDGFEIVNAAPKANEISRAERDSVVALARAHNRFLVGVSDTHGWGATSMVWNLVRAPASLVSDWCASVLHQLRQGFPAVRIVERHRLRPDSWWPMWLTPVGVLWETWRSMGWPLRLSWILWLWLPALLSRVSLARPPAKDQDRLL